MNFQSYLLNQDRTNKTVDLGLVVEDLELLFHHVVFVLLFLELLTSAHQLLDLCGGYGD